MIGQKIKKLLEIRQMKQIDLAEKLGISASCLSNYLADKRAPSIPMLCKIATVLSTDLNYFADVESQTNTLNELHKQHGMTEIPYGMIHHPLRDELPEKVVLSDIFTTGIPKTELMLLKLNSDIDLNLCAGDIILVARINSTYSLPGMKAIKRGRNYIIYDIVNTSEGIKLMSSDKELTCITNNEIVVLWVFKDMRLNKIGG